MMLGAFLYSETKATEPLIPLALFKNPVISMCSLAVFILALLYRFGPAIRMPAWKWVTPGSLFAVALLIVSTLAFAFYANHFGSYNKTYGALGAAIGFMTWLWISSIVVLVGAEINAEAERQVKGQAPSANKVALSAR